MKHTKGPWGIHTSCGNLEIHPIGDEDGVEIIADIESDGEEQQANAHLIAAAPELLEACKYVVQYHRENDSGEGELFGLDFVTTCIAAIRNAETNI